MSWGNGVLQLTLEFVFKNQLFLCGGPYTTFFLALKRYMNTFFVFINAQIILRNIIKKYEKFQHSSWEVNTALKFNLSRLTSTMIPVLVRGQTVTGLAERLRARGTKQMGTGVGARI